DISSITIPTLEGEITILPDHIPLIVPLRTGEVTFVKDNTFFGVAVSGGILEKREENKLILLVERGELATDIDIDRAEEAYKRAAEIAKSESNEVEIEGARFEAMMEKELNRINVGKKWRR
ncbi:MAG: F0F1 ATP synthase subunit epsilon, partial [Bacteroidetes bacterium]|nr:F0F1 ATP synthase subunit epsilon [Bacteroidota bacterium]